MREWFTAEYSPLSHFAPYDSELESGYAWPNVDVVDLLTDKFWGKYPEDFICEVGNDLEAEEGSWGDEYWGLEQDGSGMQSVA